MTKVDQLSSEIVSLILSYVGEWDLPSCALINKSFYREAMPLLWHTIDIWSDKAYTAFTTCLMQSPNTPGHHVRSLFITNMYAYTSVLEQDVSYLEPPLGNNINIQHIPRYCPYLTSLDIRCDRNSGASRIAQATIGSVGHYCKQLTKLDLYHCAYSNYDDLFDVLKDAPLTSICLVLPKQLDTETSQRFLETAPLALHRYPLTTLSIYVNDDTTRFIKTINTHGLTWPHLTRFHLQRCYSLTDAMALTFVQTNPTIEHLDLGYSHLGDVFLDGLVLPNLTMLSVQCNPAITAPGICRLITNYGGLKDGVYCDGCGISPKDVPNDKTYGYKLMLDDGKEPQLHWFDGTFS